jgi:hypothetical protein
MRSFGFLAAFAAFAAVSAAPIATPDHNLNAVAIGAFAPISVGNGNKIDVRSNAAVIGVVAPVAAANINKIEIDARSNAAVIGVVAPIAAVNNNKIEIDARSDTNNVARGQLNVNFIRVILDVHVDITVFLGKVNAIIGNVEAVLADTEENVDHIVQLLVPCIQELLGNLTTAVGKIAFALVGEVTGFADSTVDTTADQVVVLVEQIKGDLFGVLCTIARIIGRSHPGAAKTLADLISVLISLLNAIPQIGNVSTFNIKTLVLPIVNFIGIPIPGVAI